MIDPYDAKSRRAREMLISGIFLTISCIIVVMVAFWITDQQEAENTHAPLEAIIGTSYETGELVRVLSPGAGDCTIYATRADYDRGMGLSATVSASKEKPAAFLLPSGTRVKVVRQISGGPVIIEVLQGAQKGKQGYVPNDFLIR